LSIRKVGERAGQIVLILGIGTVTLWVGLNYGKRIRVAQADVFEILDLFRMSAPQALEPYPESQGCGLGKFLVYNIPFEAGIYSTAEPLHDVVRYYQDKFQKNGCFVQVDTLDHFVSVTGVKKQSQANQSGSESVLLVYNEKINKTILIPGTGQSILSIREDLQGDFPGRECSGIPRFPGSRRIFCMEKVERGAPFQVNIYESKASLETQRRFFGSRLEQSGWQGGAADYSLLGEGYQNHNNDMQFYERGDEKLFLGFDHDSETAEIRTVMVYIK